MKTRLLKASKNNDFELFSPQQDASCFTTLDISTLKKSKAYSPESSARKAIDRSMQLKRTILDEITLSYILPMKTEYKAKNLNSIELQKKVKNLEKSICTTRSNIDSSQSASMKNMINSQKEFSNIEITKIKNGHISKEIEELIKYRNEKSSKISAIEKQTIILTNEYENALNEMEEMKHEHQKLKQRVEVMKNDIKNIQSAKYLILKRIKELQFSLSVRPKTTDQCKRDQLLYIIEKNFKN